MVDLLTPCQTLATDMVSVTLRLSSRLVEESSMGMSWVAQLLVGPPWCQLVSGAVEDEAAGR